MSESRLVREIKKYLEEQGAYVENIWGGGFQAAGIPDIIACYKGRFLGIEVKVGKNKPSKLQEVKIELINKAGGVGIVTWDNLDDVKEVINKIDSGTI